MFGRGGHAGITFRQLGLDRGVCAFVIFAADSLQLERERERETERYTYRYIIFVCTHAFIFVCVHVRISECTRSIV